MAATVLTQPSGSTPSPQREEFAWSVRTGLTASPKRLSPRYFYDALGSRLFDAICELPSYTITRTERRLLTREGRAITSALGHAALVDLGCGNGEKAAILAAAAPWPVPVHLVDISPTALDAAARTVTSLGRGPAVCHRGTYEAGLRAAIDGRRDGEAMLVLFLGSNIGNLDRTDAEAFLGTLREGLGPRDGLLLGADLVKPERALIAAYDDPLGVTAAFDKNLLVRINRELDGDFDLDAFAHRACWNEAASRVEMHLVSLRAQVVRIPGAGCVVPFEQGETIHTESCYKYRPDTLRALGAAGGLRCQTQWVDADAAFSLSLFRPE